MSIAITRNEVLYEIQHAAITAHKHRTNCATLQAKDNKVMITRYRQTLTCTFY